MVVRYKICLKPGNSLDIHFFDKAFLGQESQIIIYSGFADPGQFFPHAFVHIINCRMPVEFLEELPDLYPLISVFDAFGIRL